MIRVRERPVFGERKDMKGWFASLAACAVLAEIAEALAPKGWREHLRRMAVLAALTVLLAPLCGLIGSGGITAAFPDLFLADGEEAEGGREAWFGAAELVFRCAEKLGIDPSSVTVAFREEDGALTGIRVTAPGCPWNLRAALEGELEAYFGAETEILTDGGEVSGE